MESTITIPLGNEQRILGSFQPSRNTSWFLCNYENIPINMKRSDIPILRAKARSASTFRISLDQYSKEHLEQSWRRLESFKELQDNWNFYGASPIDNELIEFVKQLVKDLAYQPAIFPTARESIQLEYHSGDDNYFEIEVYKDKIEYYLSTSEGEDEDEFEIDNSAALLNPKILELYAR